MIDLLLLLGIATVINWGLLDVYFYSILFDKPRQYSENWKQAKYTLWGYFRYMLGCPLCLSHWTAAGILAVMVAVGYFGGLPTALHPAAAVLFVPFVARLSISVREQSLPPLTNIYASTNESAETEFPETPSSADTKAA